MVGEGVLFGRTLAAVPASGRPEPLTALPRSARSRVSSTRSFERPTRTPSPPCIDSQPRAYSARECFSFRGDHRRVVSPRRFDRAVLRRVVDVNQTESFGVTVRPLVVIEQRPGEVAAKADALLHRVVSRAQMLPEVLNSHRLFDLA